MGRSSYELYEEWNIQPPRISTRSVLYRLEPIGIGTPQVECLTSYISRVAEAHCVYPGILMRKLIVPFVRDSSVYKHNWQAMDVKHGRQTGSLNGTLLQSTVALHAFEALTQQHALR